MNEIDNGFTQHRRDVSVKRLIDYAMTDESRSYSKILPLPDGGETFHRNVSTGVWCDRWAIAFKQ
ncbi:hypothetical protein [Phormidesmis priestleyi]|uniref:hypothetical protein n=1 Tax=Phormidesmis priestleyi TaxID=268141 RepID=UPI000839E860|nr:hypothetical protein [Phormidesmis priestleyi]